MFELNKEIEKATKQTERTQAELNSDIPLKFRVKITENDTLSLNGTETPATTLTLNKSAKDIRVMLKEKAGLKVDNVFKKIENAEGVNDWIKGKAKERLARLQKKTARQLLTA